MTAMRANWLDLMAALMAVMPAGRSDATLAYDLTEVT